MAAPPRRARRAALIAGGLALGAALGAALVLRDGTARWLEGEPAPLGRADVALVLSGDGGYERTEEAARRFRAGEVPRLLLSGNLGQVGGDNPAEMRKIALAAGVPPEAVEIEGAATSTRENVVFCRPVLERLGVRRVALVSHGYHLRRAAAAARAAFGPAIDVVPVAAPSALWRADGWWRDPWRRRVVATEYIKLVGYWIRGWL